jgi:tRNA 2-thiouridine synthesizing protein A
MSEPSPPPPTLSVDCLGWRCPRPIIELARRINDVTVGELIELRADDPAAGPDLAAWCRMRGHELAARNPPSFWVRRLS